MAALHHFRTHAPAPVARERRLQPFGKRFHPLARIGLARDLQDHLAPDAQPRAGDLRQIEPLDEKVGAPLLPRDGMANISHCRFPVVPLDQRHLPLVGLALHRTAIIARDAAFERDVGRLDHLYRRFRKRMTRDPGEAANRHYPSLAISVAVSTMRLEKPHSLSYQLTTRTSLPSITAVSRLSTVDE